MTFLCWDLRPDGNNDDEDEGAGGGPLEERGRSEGAGEAAGHGEDGLPQVRDCRLFLLAIDISFQAWTN